MFFMVNQLPSFTQYMEINNSDEILPLESRDLYRPAIQLAITTPTMILEYTLSTLFTTLQEAHDSPEPLLIAVPHDSDFDASLKSMRGYINDSAQGEVYSHGVIHPMEDTSGHSAAEYEKHLSPLYDDRMASIEQATNFQTLRKDAEEFGISFEDDSDIYATTTELEDHRFTWGVDYCAQFAKRDKQTLHVVHVGSMKMMQLIRLVRALLPLVRQRKLHTVIFHYRRGVYCQPKGDPVGIVIQATGRQDELMTYLHPPRNPVAYNKWTLHDGFSEEPQKTQPPHWNPCLEYDTLQQPGIQSLYE